ncbi:MAG: ParA family protein [Actinomycetia bacterium]|nr:ParA family protein [Actinomycetes bacterium]
MARVIALTNQKGGVGKSTTAINMSACLAEMGENIVLIDVDPQANTTSGLGVNKYKVDKSIYDAIIGKANIKELVLNTRVEGLSLIPSNIHLAGAEIELVNMMMREHRLRKVIEPIRNNYDFIIIDCPPALGILTINALVAADEVIVPIQCEYYALEGLGQLIKTIELVKNNLNKNLEISGFVMTMYDSRTKLASQVVEEVKRYFGEKVYKTIIPRNVRVSEAPSYGLPVIFYDPNCKGSLAYKNFTKEVINHGKRRIGEGT